MGIKIEHINKKFATFQALDNINLTIKAGELIALLGPSGCGKTTLLRIIAGLDQPDSGCIYFDGQNVTKDHVSSRAIGFVFQHYALFKHMSVFDNVAFGLQVQPRSIRLGKKEIKEKVMYLLKMVQLDWLANARPNQLSGGQRQRVALARALAVDPKVLLLDEPFGALDAKVRKDLRRWLRKLHHELNVTSLFVTHDQDEALEVADRIVVMNHGAIEQIGTPEMIYHTPSTPFVTEFLGEVNVFHGRMEKGYLHINAYQHAMPKHGLWSDQAAIAYVRPHELTLSRQTENSLLSGKISHVHAVGPMVRVEVEAKEYEKPIEVVLTLREFQHEQYQKGEDVALSLKNANVFVEKDLVEFVI